MRESSTRVTAFGKRRPRVLLVDDDAAMCRVTTRVLATMGLEVFAAQSAQEALRAWSGEAPFALGIIDLGLGDMDGLDLIRALREASPGIDVPFIIVSGRFAPETLPEGVVAALLKPASMAELQEAARDAILNARSGSPRARQHADGGDASSTDPHAPAQSSATRTKPAIGRTKRHDDIVEEPADDSARDRRRERG